MAITAKEAKRIIGDLLDAGSDTALVGCQDGGVNVEVIWSRKRGNGHAVMTLEEAEERTDRAIRRAYVAMTGNDVVGDPFDFIKS